MEDVKQIWSWWQSLLTAFRPVFTRPGWVRFAPWATGTVLCWEEHTITQILVSLALETKEHRTSEDVWGTCTFHESSARSPNRAETVRAHNWVVMGDLIPGQPWIFLPHTSSRWRATTNRGSW